MIIIIIIINISTFRAVMTEILRLCTHCQVSHFYLKQRAPFGKYLHFRARLISVKLVPILSWWFLKFFGTLGTIDNQAYDGFHFAFSQFGRHLHVHCLKWIFAIKFIRHDFLRSVEILLRAYPCNIVSFSKTPR